VQWHGSDKGVMERGLNHHPVVGRDSAVCLKQDSALVRVVCSWP